MINNQQIVENRRHWKGQVVDYDAIRAYETRECSYCLTDAQVSVLAGIIEPLAWSTRWQSETQPIDKDWIEQFRNDIQRRLNMGCCGDNVIYRYNEDGVLESSEDGGVTWQPAPQDDIRITAPQFPPVPGEPSPDKKCIAATGMSHLIKEQVGDQLTDEMTRYELNELIRDWTSTYIGTSNPFMAILTVAANQIFALIIAVLRPALTDEVYDILTCIFYENISDDLDFSESDIDSIREDIGGQIFGIATLFLQQLVYLMGSAGLTNLSRASGATEGDCSYCSECGIAVSFAGELEYAEYLGDCVYRLESIPESGYHVVYMWFDNISGVFDAGACGKITDFTILDGGTYYETGTVDCVTGVSHPGAPITNVCNAQPYIKSHSAFRVDVVAAPC